MPEIGLEERLKIVSEEFNKARSNIGALGELALKLTHQRDEAYAKQDAAIMLIEILGALRNDSTLLELAKTMSAMWKRNEGVCMEKEEG